VPTADGSAKPIAAASVLIVLILKLGDGMALQASVVLREMVPNIFLLAVILLAKLCSRS
jgi:hypothetical protein